MTAYSPVMSKLAAAYPTATVKGPSIRGDQSQPPLMWNPYNMDETLAVQYENGYDYAMSIGLRQLYLEDPTKWRRQPVAWREGFAEASKKLGHPDIAQTLNVTAKSAAACPCVLFDMDGTLVRSFQDQTPLPGRIEVLRQLSRLGTKMAVVTNRCGPGTEAANTEALTNLESLIGRAYFMAEPSRYQKPSGAMLLAAMESEKMDPENTIYVGNEDVDEAAASDAGIPFYSAEEFFGPAGQDALVAMEEADLL